VDGARLTAPLQHAPGAALHLCAALLAAGAVAGMYLRWHRIRVPAQGWESTFLDAADVHALLQLVLGARVRHQPALRLPRCRTHRRAALGRAGGGMKNAAPGYISTPSRPPFIVVPRLLLAAAAARPSCGCAEFSAAAGYSQ